MCRPKSVILQNPALHIVNSHNDGAEVVGRMRNRLHGTQFCMAVVTQVMSDCHSTRAAEQRSL